jgi:TMEM175 potassium channel family protein
VPDLDSAEQLRETIPQMGGFALSFAVIGLFWVAHHGLFRYIKGLNRSLVLLNLLFLGCIAFLPYPTSLLSASGDQVPATIFYAASIAAAGLTEAAVWLYAIHIRELALPGVPPAVHRWVLLRILMTPAVFLLSIPVAVFQPALAKYLWVLLFLSGLVLRRLEPPEADPATAESGDRPG